MSMPADAPQGYGANWDELGADGQATPEQLTARVMELATGTRTAVVTIAGLLDGARKYMWAQDAGAREYLDAIDEATLALASLLPETKDGQES